MERLRISPTKNALIRIRDELAFAREGKELLTQKREVLVMELLRLQDDARKAREELDELLANAYLAFGESATQNGFEGMSRLALASPPLPAIRVRERSVMGVVVPIVDKPKVEWEVRYGLAAASLAVDRAGKLLFEAVAKLIEVAEIETAIYRLAAETRKTLRRERALENLFIPQYQATVKFIQESLEERERENFYQMKLLKGRGR
jgi:V/A-type H+/Na+-transporting ATPase subunit D